MVLVVMLKQRAASIIVKSAASGKSKTFGIVIRWFLFLFFIAIE
jgi:hypothetical protein